MGMMLRLVLILCLVLTGIGLGVARGTIQAGGQVVLCTGDGVVLRDIPGAPGQVHVHLCPDMALSLLNAAIPAPPVADQPVHFSAFLPVSMLQVADFRAVSVATARDPPLLVDLI